MERFKFRVYLKYNNLMYYITGFIYNSKTNKYTFYFLNNTRKSLNKEDFILMQSTGIKDIKGNLIYEGDLLKTKKEHNLSEKDKIYEVFYSDTYSQFLARNGYCLDLTDVYKPEVVGNIYQNEDIYKEII